MTAYVGSALYVSWIHSGGTVALSGDFRQLNYSPSIEMIEETAGSDANKLYLAGVKDGQVSYSAIMQSKGTALTNALAEGTSGTLIWGPEGTVATNQKITVPAISMGVNYSQPYNDVVELSVTFQQNGARTEGVY